MTRRQALICVTVIIAAGWAQSRLPSEESMMQIDKAPAVQCYEDGSCTDGWCQPGAACDDTGR